jgi:hypothetical protein
LNLPAFRKLTGQPRHRPNSAIDIETWELDAREDGSTFAIGGCYDERGFRRFNDRMEMRGWLLGRENRGRVFWAHNGGGYDYPAIFGNYLKDRRPIMVGGKLIEFRVESGNNVTRFRDSLRLFQAPLAEIGEKLGYPKGVTPEKFKRGLRGEGIQDDDWRYLQTDCEIVYKAVEALQAEFGELRATVPSLAMNYYRRKHFQGPIHVSKDKDGKEQRWEGYVISSLDTQTRPSYHGARVEAYFLGYTWEPPQYLDIRSLYPYAMITTGFPDPSRLRVGTSLPAWAEGVVFGTAHVPLDLDPPPLPYRRPDKLLFPVGTFRGAWAGPEYRKALSLGVTFDIEKTIFAPSIPSPFESYVRHIYAQKSVSKGFTRELYKLFLNALYGKFGERHDTQTEYSEAFNAVRLAELQSEFDDVKWKPISVKRPDGFFSWGTGEETRRATNSVYCWASYVTSRARVINLETQMKLQAAGCRVLYTDTDSFMLIDNPAPSELIGDDLGQLGIEPHYVSEIWGVKHYVQDGEVKLKGVKRNARPVGLSEDGRVMAYAFESIVGVREALRRNIQAGSPKTMKRKAITPYTKRSDPDERGWTKPLVVNEP